MGQYQKYKIAIVALLAVLSMLTNCRLKKQQLAEIPLLQKTAFYTVEVTRDTVKQLSTFKVIKVTVVDTKFNYHADEAKAKTRNFLRIEIIARKTKPIIAYSEHPLFKKFDLYEESGEISSKLISLPKGQVTIRVPWFEEYHSLLITETVNFKEQTQITLKHEK